MTILGSRWSSRPARAGAGTDPRGGAARCLLIGQPGVGRTLFALRFAAYLQERGGGLNADGDGGQHAAMAPSPPAQQRVRVTLPGSGAALDLVDAGGLPAGIHPEAAVRAAAARSLRALLAADLCLHLADAAAVGGGAPVSAVDRALAAYAREFLPGRYALLAGKADHPLGRAGRLKLERELVPEKVIPVSAVTGTGFREVYAFLAAGTS